MRRLKKTAVGQRHAGPAIREPEKIIKCIDAFWPFEVPDVETSLLALASTHLRGLSQPFPEFVLWLRGIDDVVQVIQMTIAAALQGDSLRPRRMERPHLGEKHAAAQLS